MKYVQNEQKWRCSGVLLLTLNIFRTCSIVSIVNFEQVHAANRVK